jgi:hypothetical protein
MNLVVLVMGNFGSLFYRLSPIETPAHEVVAVQALKLTHGAR